MLFQSLDFIIFLPIVFTLFWLLQNHLKLQNALIFVASYVFYGWWDWRFLFLILFSTCVDYFAGLQIENAQTEKKGNSIYGSVCL